MTPFEVSSPAGILLLLALLIVIGGYIGAPKDRWQTALAFILIGATAASVSISGFEQMANPLRAIGYALLVFGAFTIGPRGSNETSRGLPTVGVVRGILWFFLGVAISSLIVSTNPLSTVVQLVGLSLVVVCFLSRRVVSRWQDSDMLLEDLAYCYKVLSAFAVTGVVALVFGFSDAIINERFRGIYENANMAAMLCIILVPISIACWRQIGVLRLAISTPAIVVTVLLSGSRTTLIAVLASFLIWLLFGSIRRVVLGFGLISVSATLATFVDPIRANRGTTVDNNAISRLFGAQELDGSLLSSRELIWADALRAYLEKPLTGYGYGNAPPASFISPFDSEASARGIVGNSFIQILVEVGPLALTLILALLIIVLFAAVRILPDPRMQFVAIAAICGVLAQGTESALLGFGQAFPWVLWMVLIGCVIQYDCLNATPATEEAP